MSSDRRTKAASYCRISTLLHGQDEMNQLVHIREFVAQRDLELVSEHVDRGVSGCRERRPALDQMLADARRGRFKVLVIAAFDRLGRDVRHLLNLVHELHELGIEIVSLRESIDTRTPHGRMTFTVLGACVEMERSLIRLRIKEALAAKRLAAAQAGTVFKLGRPCAITPEIETKICQLHEQGMGPRAIERALNRQVSRTTIARFLKARLSDNVA